MPNVTISGGANVPPGFTIPVTSTQSSTIAANAIAAIQASITAGKAVAISPSVPATVNLAIGSTSTTAILDNGTAPLTVNDASAGPLTIISGLGGLTYNSLASLTNPAANVLIDSGGGPSTINLGFGTATVVVDGVATVNAINGGDTVFATSGGFASINAGAGAVVVVAGTDTVGFYGPNAQVFTQNGANLMIVGTGGPVEGTDSGSVTISALGSISNYQYDGYGGNVYVDASAGGKNVAGTVDSVLVFEKLGRVEVESAEAGDIVAVVGQAGVDIGDTIADGDNPIALPRIEVDEPTLSMYFTVNDSPLTGEGQFLTSRHLKERLDKELQSNVALRVEPTEERDSFIVSGRGLLHLGVLIESMRREGFELAVGKPEVIIKIIDGEKYEPYEYLVIDVPQEHMGPVMEMVGARRGEMAKMDVKGAYAHIEFIIPARGLLGLRNRMMSGTQGEAIMHHNFHDYQPVRGEIPKRGNGVMISMVSGPAVGFALDSLQQRGIMFVAPGDEIYAGMIVAENARGDDMVVNPCKEKKLTNMRASGSDKNIMLKPPRAITLEIALEYIESDELVEVTPTKIRLRKKELSEDGRKRAGRSGGKVLAS